MSRGAKDPPGPLTKAVAKTLRARMKELRETKGSRQFDLTTATGISVGQISDYLTGKKTPNLDELDALCYALDIDAFDDVLSPANKLTEKRHGRGWKVKRLPLQS